MVERTESKELSVPKPLSLCAQTACLTLQRFFLLSPKQMPPLLTPPKRRGTLNSESPFHPSPFKVLLLRPINAQLWSKSHRGMLKLSGAPKTSQHPH